MITKKTAFRASLAALGVAVVAVAVGVTSHPRFAAAHGGPGYGHHGKHGHHMGWRGGRHGEGHHGGRRGESMRALFERYDANGDGALTQAELDEGRAAQITQFDANGDGQVDLAEYRALWTDAMSLRIVRAFQRHDRDGDGQVTVEEFQRRYADLVERRDRDGDGALSREDRGRFRTQERRRGGEPSNAPETAPDAAPNAAPETDQQ